MTMKVGDVDLDSYPHKTVLILTPKNYGSGAGATFPPGSEARIKEIYAGEELADEDGVIPDPDGTVLTLRLKREFYPYGR